MASNYSARDSFMYHCYYHRRLLRSESHSRDKRLMVFSIFPPTFATGRITQFLRSQVLAGLSVKPVLYGKNCHVPCAIEGAAICPSDLSWRAGNFFRVARCHPSRFLPHGIRLIAGRSFRGRIEDELSSGWNALANGAHARKSSAVASTREPFGSRYREQRICPCYTRGLFIPATSKLHALKWADTLDDSLIVQ